MASTTAAGEEASPKMVQYSLDRQVVTLPTNATTVAGALEEHGIAVTSQDSILPTLDAPITEGLAVTVVFSKDLRVKVGRRDRHVRAVQAITVNEALQQLSIELDSDDTVKPGLTATLEEGQAVTVNRVKYKRIVKREAVKNKTVTKRSSKLYKGDSRVIRAGKAGARRLVYERKIVNGKVNYTKKIKAKLVRKPVTRVVLVGTKARPTLSGVWAALARCESGGNPHAVGGGGLYFGLFQFSIGTWHSVGGAGNPANASVAEQLKRAKILQARSGWGQWPSCAGQLGLL